MSSWEKEKMVRGRQRKREKTTEEGWEAEEDKREEGTRPGWLTAQVCSDLYMSVTCL